MTVSSIDLHAFYKRFATNKSRKELFNYFLEDLETIKQQCVCCRILVFGSYISGKEHPRDMDILVSLIPEKDHVYGFMQNGISQLHPGKIDISYHKAQYYLKDPSSLIDHFNSNPINKEKNIHIDNVIEIIGF